jgi:hypothetical protein
MTLVGDAPLIPGQPDSPLAVVGHWVTANASADAGLRDAMGSLQLATFNLPQRGLVDGARQGGRGAPPASPRDEPSGSVENLSIVLRIDKRGIDCRCGKSPLLPCEHARVHVAIVVEGQFRIRAPNHSHWSTADEFDNQVGHTHALPREDREGMAGGIPYHPVKRCIRKPINDTIPTDEKST